MFSVMFVCVCLFTNVKTLKQLQSDSTASYVLSDVY